MAINTDRFIDDDEFEARHAEISHVGISGIGQSTQFGEGNLGSVTIGSLVETDGDKHYNSLIIGSGGDLVASAGKPLVVRTQGDLTISSGRSINADGRGHPGTDGTAGSSLAGASTPAVDPTPDPNMRVIAGGGGGGGGSQGDGGFVFANSRAGLGGSSTENDYDLQSREWLHIAQQSDDTLPASASDLRWRWIIPANTLRAKGDYLDIELSTGFTPTIPSFTMSLDLGGSTLFSTSLSSTVSTELFIRGRLYYVGASDLRGWIKLSQWDSTPTIVVRKFFGVAITENPATDLEFSYLWSSVEDGSFSPRIWMTRLVSARPTVSGGFTPLDDEAVGAIGSNATAVTSETADKLKSSYASQLIKDMAMGAGGAGGGGGGGGNSSGTAGSGGVAGTQTGSSTGDGSAGGNASGGGQGGGGGGGGAGGGHVVVWCGGDLTVGTGARISARGGDGGAGGDASQTIGGSGGGAGGGGGGFVGVFHAGILTNNGTVDAAAGAAGAAGGGTGIAGGAGGAGAAGQVIMQKVA